MRTSRSRSGAEPGTQAGERERIEVFLDPSLRRAVCYNRLDIRFLNRPFLVTAAPFRRVRDAAGQTRDWDDSGMPARTLLLSRQGSSREEGIAP
jgi:hypothetical protein